MFIFTSAFFGEFLQPSDKKRDGKSSKEISDFILFKKSPYLDPKNLEVARRRQFVHVGHHN